MGAVCSLVPHRATKSRNNAPMTKRAMNVVAPAGAVLAAMLLIQLPADSQQAAAGKAKSDPTAPAVGDTGKLKAKAKGGPPGPVPIAYDGRVDFSGIWNGGGPIGDIKQGLAPGEELPLLPAAK